MNLSMKWLNDYVDVSDISIRDFCHAMTLTGSKVEGWEEENSSIKNVVCGKILEKESHPNADSLYVCKVDIGAEAPIQIVTNAGNVKPGDIVPVALDGAVLPEGKIKKCKMRGVESFGMFCGLETLKLTSHDFPDTDPDGVMVITEACKPGDDVCKVIGLDDVSVEFEITSNRPDCLSVTGLAREASATFNRPLKIKKPEINGNNENINDSLSVEVRDTGLCRRYMAGFVKNVKIAPSPRWMRERLRASGIRPINNLVDITNYVMLEYGQPMHAFDLRFVDGAKIVVRTAVKGESITTLDGIKRELSDEMLVICDENKPVAVAGIMGGEYSGIMPDTQTVVFESASFDPVSVRRTSKKLGLRSDSSARFEKGLNADLAENTLKRALELVGLLGAGEVVGTIIDKDYSSKETKTAEFSVNEINTFLGTNLTEDEMIACLNKLELEVSNGKVLVPSFRIDLECLADVAEEVARIYGYNNIESTVFKGVAQASLTPKQKYIRNLEATLVGLGGNEVLTYSFMTPKHFDKMGLASDNPLRNIVRITNPLGEDTSVMRPTILASMLSALATNYSYRNESAFLFEIAKEYVPDKDASKLPAEPDRLAIGMYGGEYDFYSLKGVIEVILDRCGIVDYVTKRAAQDCGFGETCIFHPYRSAVIEKNGTPVVIFGELHPDVCEAYEIGEKAYCAKFLIPEAIKVSCLEKHFKELPKFPAITRDISVVCDDELDVYTLESTIKAAVGKTLETLRLFDVYKGSQIEEGKKSVAFSIIMRSLDGTLTDEQADAVMKRVLKALSALGAEIRS